MQNRPQYKKIGAGYFHMGLCCFWSFFKEVFNWVLSAQEDTLGSLELKSFVRKRFSVDMFFPERLC